MIIDRLCEEVKKYGPVCVGLDTKIEYLPEYLKDKDISDSEKLFEFNRKIIDDTLDTCACYKVQIAHYESLGLEGLKAYSETLKYIKENNKLSIGDIKRGDILSTATMYAKAHFEGEFEADFITVNPYMGEDAISPYYEYIKSKEKGLFVLMKTSNPSSSDFQDLEVKDEKLYMEVAKKIESWGEEFVGQSGYSSIGGVVGLTGAGELINIKNELKNSFFLIPGYGAQGGDPKVLKQLFKDGICAVINSSRKIITAHKNVDETETFSLCARKETLRMREDIGWEK
ncbi:orotidine-5'-phosphate decarboxylase [Anaeromicrobium sediminis]|uniref:Orotidine 5'-phosphate decarboxylase n=1 Tax=Anaeromicrobium sediminis TaxID=1478221 RepID=A0A267MBI2_9FIRM|nr:orotidine-5'-phosphate decarboxylase [Anaeromicrobium sediminis]PAB56170.1 orotidine-5'-phosphate decarboxylase [Anaeromicrobium sediminis]